MAVVESARECELHPPCYYCKNLLRLGDQDLKNWTCKAFPEGIPVAILLRDIDHTQEFAGDNDFRFSSLTVQEGKKSFVVSFAGDWSPA